MFQQMYGSVGTSDTWLLSPIKCKPRREGGVLGFNRVGRRLTKEGFTLPGELTRTFRLRALNL